MEDHVRCPRSSPHKQSSVLTLLRIVTKAPTPNSSIICATTTSPARRARKSSRSSSCTPATPHTARRSVRATRTSSRRCTNARPRSRATSSSRRSGGRSSHCGRGSSLHGHTVRVSLRRSQRELTQASLCLCYNRSGRAGPLPRRRNRASEILPLLLPHRH